MDGFGTIIDIYGEQPNNRPLAGLFCFFVEGLNHQIVLGIVIFDDGPPISNQDFIGAKRVFYLELPVPVQALFSFLGDVGEPHEGQVLGHWVISCCFFY